MPRARPPIASGPRPRERGRGWPFRAKLAAAGLPETGDLLIATAPAARRQVLSLAPAPADVDLREHAVALAELHGELSLADFAAAGISRTLVAKCCEAGLIKRLRFGVYGPSF